MEEDRKEYVRKLGESAGNLYYQLLQETWRLAYRWQTYRALFGKNKESFDLLAQELGECFPFVEGAIFDMTLVSIRRITDKASSGRRRNLSLRRLLDHLDSGDRPEFERILSKAESACSKIKGRVDKLVAHLDEVTVFAEAEVHGISRRDISEAIEKIGSTIKYFAAKRLNTTVLINPLHLHDATAFLITIYEGHNKKQQIYEGDVQSAKEGSWQINKSRNSYPGWLTEVPIIPMN